MEQLLRDHKACKFRTIGYHFYIRREGTMTQHRMLLEVGAHAITYNHCSIGICYEGGLDESGLPRDTRTDKQMERLTDLLTILHKLFPKAKIVGHLDLPGTTPKACPCFDAHEVFGYMAATGYIFTHGRHKRTQVYIFNYHGQHGLTRNLFEGYKSV